MKLKTRTRTCKE